MVSGGPDPVAGALPLRRIVGEGLGFGGERLLACHCGVAVVGALRLHFLGHIVGGGGDCLQTGLQGADVADHVRGGQRVQQVLGGGTSLARIARPCRQTLLEDLDLGGEVLEAPRIVGEALLGAPGLPLADLPLAVGSLEPDHAFLIDPPELVRIAGRSGVMGDRRIRHRRCAAGPRTRARARLRTRFGGGRCVVAGGVGGRHGGVLTVRAARHGCRLFSQAPGDPGARALFKQVD